MNDTDHRLMTTHKCAPPTWPHAIVVNQVIGQQSEQEVFDIHVCIPRQKPSAEQIINVFVKKLRITHVHVITDKVIVRGKFEVKAIYVGCMPCQPVHAVEIEGVRFTIDLPIPGVRCGMEADASVIVEYVDYDDGCDQHVRDERYKTKYGNVKKQHIHCGHGYDQCHDSHDECHQGHDKCHHNHDECHQGHDKYHHDHDKCHDGHKKYHKNHDHHHQPCCCSPHHQKCSREFDVSVVLRVNAKVMVDREIMNHPVYPKMPAHPKG